MGWMLAVKVVAYVAVGSILLATGLWVLLVLALLFVAIARKMQH